MKTTKTYFNTDVDTLLEDGNEYGYTREECKIYDEGLKVHFCEDIEEYEEEKEDIIKWYKKTLGLQLVNELITVNKRIAMIFS